MTPIDEQDLPKQQPLKLALTITMIAIPWFARAAF